MIRALAIQILKAGALVALGPLFPIARWGVPHLMNLRRRRHAPPDR